MDAPKVLVAGSVGGHFREFFEKLAEVNTKSGPFASCFCVGDFFAPDTPDALAPLRDGTVTVPLPTYFCCEARVRPADLAPLAAGGGALGPNLFYLGGTSGIKQIAGLAVAFLAHESAPARDALVALAEAHSAPPAPSPLAGAFVAATTATTAPRPPHQKQQNSGAGGIDILLTNTVPLGVTAATAPGAAAALAGAACSACVRDAARMLRPRYHFAGGAGVYWARAPYRNEPWARTRAGSQHFFTTRFYALAPVANAARQRYLFAAAVRPVATMQHEDVPPDTTESPYRRPDPVADVGEEAARPAKRARFQHGQQQQQQRDGQQYFLHQSDACWFCLANPAAETHLVAHVGAHCYVSVAKGPVCAGHVLVVPCAHVPSTAALAPAARAATLRTVRAVVRALVAPTGPFRARAVAVFERHIPRTVADRRSGRTREIYAHGYVHVVPLPHTDPTQGAEEAAAQEEEDDAGAVLERAFEEAAGAEAGARFGAADWARDARDEPFFWYRVVARGAALEADESGSFPVRVAYGVGEALHINFGRVVVCRAAGREGRADWHRCVLPRDEEERETRMCRDALAPFLPPEDDENDDDDDEGSDEGGDALQQQQQQQQQAPQVEQK